LEKEVSARTVALALDSGVDGGVTVANAADAAAAGRGAETAAAAATVTAAALVT
jgi:hypothetical protein